MFCPECGHEMVEVSTPLEEEFKGETFLVEGVTRNECPHCGEYVISSADCDILDDKLQAEYRKRHGLLSPREIAAIRELRGWTQKEFEAVLGVGSPTVCRWETGRVIQSKPLDNLMRGIRDYTCFAEDLAERAEAPRRSQSFTVRGCVKPISAMWNNQMIREAKNVR